MTERSETFCWTQEPWGRALRCTALEPLARHLFTTRDLALGADGTWRALAVSLEAADTDLALVRQVHGAAVARAADEGEAPPGAMPEADAIVTSGRRRALVVRVADCVPILLADSQRRAVGAAHAGWRGTAACVARSTVDALAHLGALPADLVAAIGPSIGPCCLEVRQDVLQAFAAAGHDDETMARWFSRDPNGTLRLDLWRANQDQLIRAGVPPDHVHIARLCTACRRDLFYSYRAEGPGTGRLAGAIRALPPRP
jgi:YfiH family protein